MEYIDVMYTLFNFNQVYRMLILIKVRVAMDSNRENLLNVFVIFKVYINDKVFRNKYSICCNVKYINSRMSFFKVLLIYPAGKLLSTLLMYYKRSYASPTRLQELFYMNKNSKNKL